MAGLIERMPRQALQAARASIRFPPIADINRDAILFAGGLVLASKTRLAISVFRIAYGGFFLVVGLYGGYSVFSGGGNPFAPDPGPAADFQNALEATGFVVPLMLACYVIGGTALLFSRTAPLGIILLAPFVAVIVFYHLFLGGSALWAGLWGAGLLLLAWRYRDAFTPLVRFSDAGSD